MALKNAQYESIMKSYEHRRDRNRRLWEERRDAIYRQLPDYEKLDSSVASVSVAMARQMLSDDADVLQQLRDTLHDIASQKKALLVANGYPEDYLEPLYTCPDCRDTGYIEEADGFRTKCHCFRDQEITLLYEQSNIRDQLRSENFDTLSYQYYQGEDLERFKKATSLSKDFVQKFEQDYRNLFFYGTVGTGKSFLSGCIAHELLNAGNTVLYFSAQSLFETLARFSFEEKSKEALYNFYDDLYNCDLVIIDDLGTELTNSFVATQLFACLNERHLRKKSTIISTNLSLEELHNRYSDRIFSRIVNQYELCKLTGSDIRILRKRNNANV